MNKRGGVLSDTALEIGASVLIVVIFITFLSFVVPKSSGEGFKAEVIARDLALEIKVLEGIKEEVDVHYTISKDINLKITSNFVKVDEVIILTESNLEADFEQEIKRNTNLLFSKRGNKLEVKVV
ncbi:hypothetical protein J4414_04045 [Candidatus Woesearchaeota archaeon]|nr:hypothetical protein [Candidatus Woesearchaeota archaeon]